MPPLPTLGEPFPQRYRRMKLELSHVRACVDDYMIISSRIVLYKIISKAIMGAILNLYLFLSLKNTEIFEALEECIKCFMKETLQEY